MSFVLTLNWNHGGISGDVHFAGHLMTYGRIEQPSDVIRYTVHMKYAGREGARTVTGNR